MNEKLPVFDAHVHIYPDAIAEKVVGQLGSVMRDPVSFDGTHNGLITIMHKAGIAGALNAPVATRADKVESLNNWAIARNKWPVLSFGSIHPDFNDIRGELQRIHDSGLMGIKLHPEYQEFFLDEPRMQPIWQGCVDLGLKVLLHAGNDWAFQPPCRAAPAAIARLVSQWPLLQLMAAHFGGFDLWDQVEDKLLGLPIYLDTSFAAAFMSAERFVKMVRQHGVARVIFATDAPWQDPVRALEYFRQLPFTKEEQHAILWENAATWLNLNHVPGVYYN